jgi:hypothetical protein
MGQTMLYIKVVNSLNLNSWKYVGRHAVSQAPSQVAALVVLPLWLILKGGALQQTVLTCSSDLRARHHPILVAVGRIARGTCRFFFKKVRVLKAGFLGYLVTDMAPRFML